ncbi:hypothetical protein [Streptomyces sp. NPDC059378]|uniref:hypothetical protein n=1 Tax=Streptomyces sp. NPDC059378 TaxID=3346815 RepID=UPI003697DAF0
MSSFHLTPQQSWQVLVTTSQHSNTKLHLVASALLQTSNGRSLTEPLAKHLATAVRAHSNPAALSHTGSPRHRDHAPSLPESLTGR